MTRRSLNKKYPINPEEMFKVLKGCAFRNGFNVVFCETYNEEIHIHIKEGDTMRDKYEAGQAGAQGPDAHVHDMTFNQIWSQVKENVDLPTLAKELNTLRNELHKSANTAKDYAELGAIASAEIEAQKGDGPKALYALAKASKWALSVAEKIGVDVATAAIKTACGL